MGPQVSPFYRSSETLNRPGADRNFPAFELSLHMSDGDLEKAMAVIEAGNAGGGYNARECGYVNTDRLRVMSSEEIDVGEDSGFIGSGNKVWKPAVWSHSAPPSPVGRSPRPAQPYENDLEKPNALPFPLTPRPQQSTKGRPSLPPLQPLSITRRSLEEWSKGGFEDRRAWTPPSTPGRRRENKVRNSLDIKLDLGAVNRNRDTSEPSELQLKRDKFAYFDKECSRVAEHIYLGSDAVARNRETLRANGITHVLNCVGFMCREYFPEELSYLTLWLQDSPCEDITSILYDVFDYFEEVREQGGRVFVHCYQGVSRSTSLVIAYLMWREGRSFEDAFGDVKAARGITNPNMGFACQLLQAQKRVHAAPVSPNSVLRMYRISPHSPYDPLHLVPRTVSNPGVSALDSRGAFIVHVPNFIFVWEGKACETGLVDAAHNTARQVVRYERAQGPIALVHEDREPSEFWDALRRGGSPQDAAKSSIAEDTVTEVSGFGIVEENGSSETRGGYGSSGRDESSQPGPRTDLRLVEAYDNDFELFRKAKQGIIASFPVSGVAVTRVPSKDSGWGRLRCKFFSGPRGSFSKSNGSFRERDSVKPGGACEKANASSEGRTQDGSVPSAASPDPSVCSNSSLFSQESASSASSRFPSPVSSSPSPFPSPSLSRLPSGSSASWSPPASSNPSPVSSDSPPPPPSPSPSPAVDRLHEENRSESSSAGPSLSRSSSLPLAQRRGGVSPSLRLPALVDDPPATTPRGGFTRKPKLPPISVARSPAPLDFAKDMGAFRLRLDVPGRLNSTSVDEAVDSTFRTEAAEGAESSSSKPQGGFSDEYFDCEEGETPYYTPNAPKPQSLQSLSRDESHSAWGNSFYGEMLVEDGGGSPKLFEWPRMEKINMFDADDLDSRATFILWVPGGVPDNSDARGEASGQVYVWVGRDSRADGEGATEGGTVNSRVVRNVDGRQIGTDFLEQTRLLKDTPVMVVDEGSEPESFWDNFRNG